MKIVFEHLHPDAKRTFRRLREGGNGQDEQHLDCQACASPWHRHEVELGDTMEDFNSNG